MKAATRPDKATLLNAIHSEATKSTRNLDLINAFFTNIDGQHILQFAIQNNCKTFIEKVIKEDKIDLSKGFLHQGATPCQLSRVLLHHEIQDMMQKAIDRKIAATKIQKITRGFLVRKQGQGPTL
jgi:hypothetical protein